MKTVPAKIILGRYQESSISKLDDLQQIPLIWVYEQFINNRTKFISWIKYIKAVDVYNKLIMLDCKDNIDIYKSLSDIFGIKYTFDEYNEFCASIEDQKNDLIKDIYQDLYSHVLRLLKNDNRDEILNKSFVRHNIEFKDHLKELKNKIINDISQKQGYFGLLKVICPECSHNNYANKNECWAGYIACKNCNKRIYLQYVETDDFEIISVFEEIIEGKCLKVNDEIYIVNNINCFSRNTYNRVIFNCPNCDNTHIIYLTPEQLKLYNPNYN